MPSISRARRPSPQARQARPYRMSEGMGGSQDEKGGIMAEVQEGEKVGFREV